MAMLLMLRGQSAKAALMRCAAKGSIWLFIKKMKHLDKLYKINA
jgi:hypothetical protein